MLAWGFPLPVSPSQATQAEPGAGLRRAAGLPGERAASVLGGELRHLRGPGGAIGRVAGGWLGVGGGGKEQNGEGAGRGSIFGADGF